MADLKKEEQEEVDRLAEPCAKEQEILGGNEVRDEALKKVEETKKEVKEDKLPKLSAAEFRAYNSMAEHMEYFVSATTATGKFEMRIKTEFTFLSSITISDNPGQSSKMPATTTAAQITCPSKPSSLPASPSSSTSKHIIPSKKHTSSPCSQEKCQNSSLEKMQQSY